MFIEDIMDGVREYGVPENEIEFIFREALSGDSFQNSIDIANVYQSCVVDWCYKNGIRPFNDDYHIDIPVNLEDKWVNFIAELLDVSDKEAIRYGKKLLEIVADPWYWKYARITKTDVNMCFIEAKETCRDLGYDVEMFRESYMVAWENTVEKAKRIS